MITEFPEFFPKIGEPVKGRLYQAPTKQLSQRLFQYLKLNAYAWMDVDKNSPPNKVWFRITIHHTSRFTSNIDNNGYKRGV